VHLFVFSFVNLARILELNQLAEFSRYTFELGVYSLGLQKSAAGFSEKICYKSHYIPLRNYEKIKLQSSVLSPPNYTFRSSFLQSVSVPGGISNCLWWRMGHIPWKFQMIVIFNLRFVIYSLACQVHWNYQWNDREILFDRKRRSGGFNRIVPPSVSTAADALVLKLQSGVSKEQKLKIVLIEL